MMGEATARLDRAGPALSRFHLHSIEEVLRQATPQWLIDGVMETNTLSVLYGPPGVGKTFVGLDWALSIATGTPWLGRPTRRGPAVYVGAEGGRSLGKRVNAWLTQRRISPQSVEGYFVLEAVQLRSSAEWDLLRRQIERHNLGPALIVFDTLASCFVGGEENSAKDVGELVAACRSVEQETGAAVMLIHHTGKSGESERGSSALRAAADVMVEISRSPRGGHVIANTKQKDAEPFTDLAIDLAPVVIGRDDVSNREMTSCVVVAREDTGRVIAIPRHAQMALETLRRFENAAASSRQWREAAGLSDRTFHRSRESLLTAGFVRLMNERANWYQVADVP